MFSFPCWQIHLATLREAQGPGGEQEVRVAPCQEPPQELGFQRVGLQNLATIPAAI